jgi:hypothetical protein
MQIGPASLGTAPRTDDPKAASVGGLVHIRPSLSVFRCYKCNCVARAGAVAERVTRLPFSGPKLNQNAVEAVPLLHPMTCPFD